MFGGDPFTVSSTVALTVAFGGTAILSLRGRKLRAERLRRLRAMSLADAVQGGRASDRRFFDPDKGRIIELDDHGRVVSSREAHVVSSAEVA